MAWTATEGSHVFRAYIADILDNITAMDYITDVVHVALYNNTGTPDNDVAVANTAYAVGQWVVGNEVSEAGQWAAAGVALAGKVISVATADVVMVDATTDTASGTAADLANVYGCLVYDQSLAAPVDNQGFCFNYFGGANSVVNGTFTVVWNANGIFRFTL